MIIYQKVKAICSISFFTLFRNGKTSTVYYRTLSFFGFRLKKVLISMKNPLTYKIMRFSRIKS